MRTGRVGLGLTKALFFGLALSLTLGGCSWFGGSEGRGPGSRGEGGPPDPVVKGEGKSTGADRTLVQTDNNSSWMPSIFSKKSLPPDSAEDQAKGGIGVNGFLWRASLDTLSFLPLASADPFGGVIITEWYSAADTPEERIKVTVYILDRRLRADAVRVVSFKQTRDASGGWVDAAVAPETNGKLENAILTRARQLRIDVIG